MAINSAGRHFRNGAVDAVNRALPAGIAVGADARVRVALNDAPGSVGGGIVPDDQLEVSERLRQGAVDGRAQKPGVVERGQDDGDLGQWVLLWPRRVPAGAGSAGRGVPPDHLARIPVGHDTVRNILIDQAAPADQAVRADGEMVEDDRADAKSGAMPYAGLSADAHAGADMAEIADIRVVADGRSPENAYAEAELGEGRDDAARLKENTRRQAMRMGQLDGWMDEVRELLTCDGEASRVEVEDRSLRPGPGHAEQETIFRLPGVVFERHAAVRQPAIVWRGARGGQVFDE